MQSVLIIIFVVVAAYLIFWFVTLLKDIPTAPLKLIYIASPYSIGDKQANVQRQIDIANTLIDEGFTPIVPLLYHYLDQTKHRNYEDWIDIDFSLLRECHGVLRLSGESIGADKETAYAETINIPVFYGIGELLDEKQYREMQHERITSRLNELQKI